MFGVFLEYEANMKAELYTSGHVITKQAQKDKLNLSWTQTQILVAPNA